MCSSFSNFSERNEMGRESSGLGIIVGLLLIVIILMAINKKIPDATTNSEGVSSASVSEPETGVQLKVKFESKPASESVSASDGRCTSSSAEYLKKAEHYFVKSEQGASGGDDASRNFALLASAAAELHQVCMRLEKEQ